MDLSVVFAQNDGVLIGCFLLLVAMSVVTWATALIKMISGISSDNKDKNARANFNAKGMVDKSDIGPMAELAASAIAARKAWTKSKALQNLPLDEHMIRALRTELDLIEQRFEKGLSSLASIGSTSPFVGLFGTVWGIYHALINIGLSGQMSIEAVATPIGEALIATALGLVVAVPAVLFYNAFVRINKSRFSRLDAFAHDLHVSLLCDADGCKIVES